ncbi:MAG: hypothetical protein C0407_08540 [Desulfobacca sp.]|nr:hypothetical protein [Desulfobacca sp.]
MELTTMPESGIFLPGTKALIEIPQLLDSKSQTFFRGYKEDQFIILDFPHDAKGGPLPLKDLMPCIVRFFFQGKEYSFKSEIQKILPNTYPLVFINYPQAFDSISLRNSERCSMRIPTVYSRQLLEGDQEEQPVGQMLDLSEMGCLLEADQCQELDDRLFLTFTLPNQDVIKNLEAKIRRISRKGDLHHLGVLFVNSTDPRLQKIRTYLSFLESFQL